MKAFLGFLLVLLAIGLTLTVRGILAIPDEHALADAMYCPGSEVSPSPSCLGFANGFFITQSGGGPFTLFSETVHVFLWRDGVDPASCTSSCTLPPISTSIPTISPFGTLDQLSSTPDRIETWNGQVITIDEPNGTVIHTLADPTYVSPTYLTWGIGLAVGASLFLIFLAVNAGISPLRFFNPFFVVEAVIKFLAKLGEYSGD